MYTFTLSSNLWEPLFWSVLGAVGVVGLVALVSPRGFAAMAMRSGQWIDSEKILEKLDQRFDVDQYVLPYSRTLGCFVIASVVILAGRFIQH
jgi:hypothetical protein